MTDGERIATFLPIVTSADNFNADCDGDAVPDIIDYDNDNDGFSDRQEVMASNIDLGVVYDPWDANSHPDPTVTDLDADADGIIDADDADDDNDGINDAQELTYGTDPYMRDSDGDGRFDKEELDHNYDPLDSNNYAATQDAGSSKNWYAGQTIDSRNLNANGDVVFVRGYPVMTDFNLPAGTTIYFDKGGRLYSADLASTPFNLELWPGSGSRTLDIVDTSMLNQMITGMGRTDIKDSFVEHIATSSTPYMDGAMMSRSVFGSVANGQASLRNSAVFHSRLEASGNSSSISGSLIEDSFVAYTNTDTFSSSYSIDVAGSRINNTVINLTGRLDVDSTDAYINDMSIWDNVLFISDYTGDSRFSADLFIIRNSDFVMPNLGVAASLELDAEFDNVAFELQGMVLDTGFGTPSDLLGDGVTDTEITFININSAQQSFFVDGLNNPRSTRVFPGGVSDLWNPSGVGNY
jgi:hypothetical protein